MDERQYDYSDLYDPSLGWTLEEFNNWLNEDDHLELFLKYGIPRKPKGGMM